jgi:hypothetical protein
LNESDIKKYLTYAFLAAAAAAIFMFGESCFKTSNPVWTAETLRWLSPLVLIVAVVGFFCLAIIENTFLAIGSALVSLFLIVSLGLNAEIKDKNEFLNPTQVPSNTVYVPVPSGNGAYTFDQNQIQGQLDAVKQSACNSANELQFQWVQLNSQLQQLRINSDGSFETDRLIQQLQMQVFQLQQQESNLRQQCNG